MNNLERFVESIKTETEQIFEKINMMIQVKITGALKRIVKQ